jgi:hypothetical protein
MGENPTFTIGENHLADYTREEYRQLLGYIPRNEPHESRYLEAVKEVDVNALPSSVDWRTKGAVTPVKD